MPSSSRRWRASGKRRPSSRWSWCSRRGWTGRPASGRAWSEPGGGPAQARDAQAGLAAGAWPYLGGTFSQYSKKGASFPGSPSRCRSARRRLRWLESQPRLPGCRQRSPLWPFAGLPPSMPSTRPECRRRRGRGSPLGEAGAPPPRSGQSPACVQAAAASTSFNPSIPLSSKTKRHRPCRCGERAPAPWLNAAKAQRHVKRA